MQRLFGLFLFVFMSSLQAQASQPNIIVFIADDISWDDYSCYGNKTIQTPNIDKLAEGGLLFEQAFLTASSCSPSRASIITGRYPHNNGKAQNLHDSIPKNIPWVSEVMGKAGYRTVLSGKNHMSKKLEKGSSEKVTPFDVIDSSKVKGGESGGHALWTHHVKNRDKTKPFFYWYASTDAHRGWESSKKWNKKLLGPSVKPEDVVVPKFYIDDAETRQDLAYYFDEVRRFDFFIGKTIEALKEEGIFEDTLIFVLADNGRPFPRAKTRLHDSGMKTGLVAHWPKGIKNPGRKISSLVSVIDIAPTMIASAGQKVGESFQGVSLLPLFNDAQDKVRDYVFSEHNWHDYEALARSVRFQNFLYIENHRPNTPWQGPADSVRSPTYVSLLNAKGSLTKAQADVTVSPRAKTELFMNSKDALQLNNLSGQPEYKSIEKQLKNVLSQWTEKTGDTTPANVKPDGFDRVTGRGVEGFKARTEDWGYAGESTKSHLINHKGPVLK